PAPHPSTWSTPHRPAPGSEFGTRRGVPDTDTKCNRQIKSGARRVRRPETWRRNSKTERACALLIRSRMNVLGELLLVTSSIAVSLAVSRLALNELFRLVRITPRPPHDPPPR